MKRYFIKSRGCFSWLDMKIRYCKACRSWCEIDLREDVDAWFRYHFSRHQRASWNHPLHRGDVRTTSGGGDVYEDVLRF